ncbi:MAG: hypothetical protein LWX11_11885, partial [Firmicutes bacterium]|nr:hypothetical protein [Bacillota bacterium]
MEKIHHGGTEDTEKSTEKATEDAPTHRTFVRRCATAASLLSCPSCFPAFRRLHPQPQVPADLC